MINRVSIRWKLVLVTLVAVTAAQLFAGAIMAWYDTRAFRAQKTREIAAEAAILANSVTASLAFGDVKATGSYLNALKANPEITAAAVYGADGGPVAAYTKTSEEADSLPARAEAPERNADSGNFATWMPVVEANERLGTVYLRVATEPALDRLLRYGAIVLFAGFASLLVAVPIALRLNAAISSPIRKIAGAAARIAAGDFNVAVDATARGDEVGLLTEAFRRMVAGVRDMTGELEQRVASRTAQLEAANKELEAFSYSVSHDLRAPLRAIDGFARILEEDYAPGFDAEGRRLVSVVRANSRKMGALIDDLLAFSKIGRQSIKRAPINMTALVREVWSELGVDNTRRAVGLSIKALPPAEGDRALLKQVWANLLSNAVKYSGQRERAEIEVGGEVEAGGVVYRVADNGAGFDMKYYDKLFGVFQRLHSAAQFPGTGVGLAIVQRIVVRHGGRVWAESEAGNGARFYFSLPRAAAPAAEPADLAAE